MKLREYFILFLNQNILQGTSGGDRAVVSKSSSQDTKMNDLSQHVSPDLDPNCLTLKVFLKEFFEKVEFEKSQQTTKA